MMRALSAVVAVLVVFACEAARASDPVVAGDLQGLELAAQSELNPAVFVGLFTGEVDESFAFGFWSAGVEHETPLPAAFGETIAITGGQWKMQLWTIRGFRLRRVTLGGEIGGQLAFLETDRFAVAAVMNVTSGGSGDILLNLLLDHTVFPPGVLGELSQP